METLGGVLKLKLEEKMSGPFGFNKKKKRKRKINLNSDWKEEST